MRRVLIVIGLGVLMVLPIILILIQNKTGIEKSIALVKTSTKRQVSERYSAVSKVPEYSLTLTDTAYLDYLSELLGLFKPQAIVDPRVHRGFDIKNRYTISRIQLLLIPTSDDYLLGISGVNDFAGRGNYVVEGDTLVVRISLNPSEAKGKTEEHRLDEVYLQAVYQVLYHAHGVSDFAAAGSAFEQNKLDIIDYLYGGIFAWPVSVSRKK
jgi:hypothetical protein